MAFFNSLCWGCSASPFAFIKHLTPFFSSSFWINWAIQLRLFSVHLCVCCLLLLISSRGFKNVQRGLSFCRVDSMHYCCAVGPMFQYRHGETCLHGDGRFDILLIGPTTERGLVCTAQTKYIKYLRGTRERGRAKARRKRTMKILFNYNFSRLCCATDSKREKKVGRPTKKF